MSTTEAVPSIKAKLVDNLTSPILVVKCMEKTSKSEMLSRQEESEAEAENFRMKYPDILANN